MLSYEQFKQQYLGKGIDYDGDKSDQCVDLAKLAIDKMYGVTPGYFLGSAKQAYIGKNWDAIGFERINNTPDGVPKQGDIIFRGWNKYGHVAIVESADKKWVTVLEQNGVGGGTGTGGNAIRLKTYSYKSILGRIHKKGV